MAAEDVALALTMLTNEEILTEVTRGDLRRFEGFELTDEERETLARATHGVVSIEEQVPVVFRSGEEIEMSGPGGAGRGFAYWPPATAEAIRYVQENLKDPRIQATFVAWQEERGNKFP